MPIPRSHLPAGRLWRSCTGFLSVIVAVLVLAVPATAAKKIPVEVRVEGANGPLASPKRYLAGTTTISTIGPSECGGKTTGRTRLAGATALGVLAQASRSRKTLRPLRVQKFSFGLLTCGIGKFVGSAASSYWLYKVNHKAPTVGADQYRLKRGDEVLWFFQDTEADVNTGDELRLRAPNRARPGRSFRVIVYSYSSSGKVKRAAGATVKGPTTKVADKYGRATFNVRGNRRVHLRATRGSDIPSAKTAVCVNRRWKRCPSARR